MLSILKHIQLDWHTHFNGSMQLNVICYIYWLSKSSVCYVRLVFGLNKVFGTVASCLVLRLYFVLRGVKYFLHHCLNLLSVFTT